MRARLAASLRALLSGVLLAFLSALLTAIGVLPAGAGFGFFVVVLVGTVILIGRVLIGGPGRRPRNSSPVRPASGTSAPPDGREGLDPAWRQALQARREHWRRLMDMTVLVERMRHAEAPSMLLGGQGWIAWQRSYRDAELAQGAALREFRERYDVDFAAALEEPARGEVLHVDRVFQAHAVCRFGHLGAHHLIGEGWSVNGRPRVVRECAQCEPSTMWLEWSTS